MQAVVSNNYENLQSDVNIFQNILKKTYQQQKVSARPKRLEHLKKKCLLDQATLTYMFSRASSSK